MTPYQKLKVLFLLFLAVNYYSVSNAQNKIPDHGNVFPGYVAMEKIFRHPGDAVQTSVYWYWISGNISKEGVVKDLESMKQAGINRAFIGNIELDETARGKVSFFSDEWWDIMHTALKTATRLNIEIGIFNSPGWSQSGGPWIKQEQSMRYLASSETSVQGGKHVSVQLKKPTALFQDVKVIAFPAPLDYYASIADQHPQISCSLFQKNVQALMDKDSTTEVSLPLDSITSFTIEAKEDFTARSMVIYPAHRPMIANIKIQVAAADGFRTIKECSIDRSNPALNVGFDPYGRVAISLPATRAKIFRVLISNLKTNYARSWGPAPGADAGIQELQLLSSPKIENYIEKTLAKMSQTPFPLWPQYLWPAQNDTKEKNLVIDPTAVLDISTHMAADGMLNWDAPPGEWIIVRSGMAPTGVTNSPAPPNGTGLEVDKINKDYLTAHFNGYIGEILRRIPAADRKTFKLVVEDSYETGGQNWTDGLVEKFKTAFGYDPAPYIPVLYGSVTGSAEMSNRFLWDLRRFIADRVSFDYVGGLRDISHKHGLTTWLENYGHWGFPGEFLQYGGQSDEIGGEFWSEGDLGNIENRAASSSAHIYGKTKVSAESFTCGGAAFSRYPATMKQRGDRFFTEGINNTLLHVYIEQPYPDKWPGVNAGFSNEFNRHNTWFKHMPLFTDYLKRCNYMLQQGSYVADLAYFIGEDAPKMTGICDPAVPKGYSFDYINADVIKERITVKNGRLVLPNGISYRMLVLPKLETMRPELLLKIKELVQQGAVVFGPAPNKAPGLQQFPNADISIKKTAAALWGNIDGKNITVHRFGKGMLINGMDLQEALTMIHAAPDFKTTGADSVLFIHRKINNDDVYFISNQHSRKINFDASFQLNGKIPELWDAVGGDMRMLTAYTIEKNTTTVPLVLDENGSAFIVFRKKAIAANTSNNAGNFPLQHIAASINTPWQVYFDTARRGPPEPVVFNELKSWTESNNEKIKYYSGSAVYRNSFSMVDKGHGQRLLLDMGVLTAMATVEVNGVEAGGVWTAPYQLDITKYVQKGMNSIAITVTNTWVNRLIGDLGLPENERKTWVNVNPYTSTSPLQPAGLLGPVSIKSLQYK